MFYLVFYLLFFVMSCLVLLFVESFLAVRVYLGISRTKGYLDQHLDKAEIDIEVLEILAADVVVNLLRRRGRIGDCESLENLAVLIKGRRRELGLSRVELAEKLGYGAGFVVLLEVGLLCPEDLDEFLLLRLSEFLDLDRILLERWWGIGVFDD